KQYRTWNNRHSGYIDIKPDSFFLQIVHDTRRSFQPVSTATGQTDGMDGIYRIDRVQQIGFARTRCTATYIDTTDGTFLGKYRGTACYGFHIFDIAYLDATDICYISIIHIQHPS